MTALESQIEARYRAVRAVPEHPALHEQGIAAVYRSILRPGDTAVDGGAHAGKHTIGIAEAVGAAGRVVAFEPQEAARRRLVAALADRHIEWVDVRSCALSRPPARVATFLVFPDRPGVSGFERRTDAAGDLPAEEIVVQTSTLDAEVETGPVTFVKLDVEGAELDALEGGRRLLAEWHPVVHVEASYISWDPFGYGPKEMLALANEFGYEVVDVIGEPMRTVADLDLSFRTAGVWDYLLLPRSDAGRAARAAIVEHARRHFPAAVV